MGDEDERGLGSETGELEPVQRGRNVIAVIGIDEYQHWRRLNNAVEDARGLRQLFLDLGFQELAGPLFNENATLEAINSLVQDDLSAFLQPDDSLVIFFAGHGHTESGMVGGKVVQTGYLIPLAGRLPEERKFSTYLKLESFLDDVAKLPARHVLVILDSCFSGFALSQNVTVLRSQERYTEDLNRRVSRRVITSALQDQPALDNGPVADHSLFTGTLIEALEQNKADAENKGFVTSSELALYVQKNVASWSQSKQTPDFGAFGLDERGELVISLRGESQNKRRALESLAVAGHVYELGWITDDLERFPSAARQYQETLKYAALGKLDLPQAELGLGKALFAAHRMDEALQALSGLANRLGDKCPAEAWLFLGLAHARLEDYKLAVEALQVYAGRQAPGASSAWVEAYIDWLRQVADAPAVRKRALLVGIDRYQYKKLFKTNGCVNDVQKLLGPALQKVAGFKADEITILKNEAATRARFQSEFERLQRETGPQDAVIVQFSGHSVPANQPDAFGRNDVENVYLFLHDTADQPGYLSNGVSADELHAWMQSIPAGHKTLILDTHASDRIVELVEKEANYALILASDTAETAYEWRVNINEKSVACGMLSGALYTSLLALGDQPITYNAWVTPAIRFAREATASYPTQQTPLFIGIRDKRAFGGDDPFLGLYEFAQRRIWPEVTPEELLKRYLLFRHQVHIPHPLAYAAFGRAFITKGLYAQAIEALQAGLANQPDGSPGQSWLDLGHAYLALGKYSLAKSAFEQYAAVATQAEKATLEQLAGLCEQLDGAHRYALLVGIDRYLEPALSGTPSAVADVKTLAQVLVQRWGFAEGDIVLLLDEAATRSAILDEFAWLVNNAPKGSGLFYFAGMGTRGADDLPALIAADSRSQNSQHKIVEDVNLIELVELASASPSSLLSILDASFERMEQENTRSSPARMDMNLTLTPEDRSALVSKLTVGSGMISDDFWVR